MNQLHKRKFDLSVRLIVVASLIFMAVAASVSVAVAAPASAPTKPLAKNIIVMIADGSGYNQNIAADLYQYGEVGLQPLGPESRLLEVLSAAGPASPRHPRAVVAVMALHPAPGLVIRQRHRAMRALQ